MNIGVLAVQGAFAEHVSMLEKMNVASFEIRKKSDLDKHFDGLILPGGESTVMGKLLIDLDMLSLIRDYINNGMPVFGTCAGMILLAKKIEDTKASHIATMDITVMRNAYGRQLGSFNAVSEFLNERINMPFIRAPYIKTVGSEVKVLTAIDGKIVAAQQNNQLAVAFHPELTEETAVHEHFLNIIKKKINLTNAN
ncbi:MAG: pyridoxal 5'-phosphate synthase glutaminase subunit PdxT [Bacillota bacterium]|nr:pyridoxal 5'-phosphate synthase glutaminase subunit PdxT [Bacillota bacterium]